MRKLFPSAIIALALASRAFAADSTVPAMTGASALDGTELYYCIQGGADRKCTGAQVKTSVITTAVRATSTTSEALANSDQGKLVTFSNASAVACTIAQAGGGGNFAAGWAVSLKNLGAGTVTCTPATSTVDGAATFTLTTGQGTDLYSDGANYFTQPGKAVGAAGGDLSGLYPNPTVAKINGSSPATVATSGSASDLGSGILAAARGGAGTINGALKGNGSGAVSQAACADLSNGTALCSTTPGSGVATAAAAALSAAGGLTTTIGSGTKVMATSAIGSGACTSAQTVTVTGTATTDVVLIGFNGDPTGVTGFAASANGMLTIIAYPTADTVNIKECNNTASSITPGAHTLNARVLR